MRFSSARDYPHVKRLKKQITIRLDASSVDYFKRTAAELGIPYRNLINLFLRGCAAQKRRPIIRWPEGAPSVRDRAHRFT